MDIYVVAGQSNAAGRGGVRRDAQGVKAWDGDVSHLPPCVASGSAGAAVFSFRPDEGWAAAVEPLHAGLERKGKVAGVGFATVMAERVRAHTGAHASVGVVPCAHGETAVREWEAGSGWCYAEMCARVRAALAAAPPHSGVRGLVFFQGESDCAEEGTARVWPAAAAEVVRSFARELGQPRLAAVFVLPSPLPDAPNGRALCKHIEVLRVASAEFDLARSLAPDADACVIDAQALPLEADGVHLTSAAQALLGRRIADAFVCGADALLPEVSVLMPCRNAMPWLALAVGSVLLQRSVRLELIAVDDSSVDGSGEFLDELAALLEEGRVGDGSDTDAAAASAAQRAVEAAIARAERGETPETDWDRTQWEACDECKVLTAHGLAAAWRAQRAAGVVDTRLVVRRVRAFGPSGQGRALNAALHAARAPLVGEMESDDVRPLNTYAVLCEELLEGGSELDGVASCVGLCGWEREGMQRYARWQNGLVTNEEMERGRWLEIPAMRASGLYRAGALRSVLCGYRDLWEMDADVNDREERDARGNESSGLKRRRVVVDCAVPEGVDAYAAAAARPPEGWWPVDSDFWMRWFAAGLRIRKVTQELYLWRQYPAQSTRTHSRCSLERLRACKAYHLMQQLRTLHAAQIGNTGAR